jgi:hypothetical protein
MKWPGIVLSAVPALAIAADTAHKLPSGVQSLMSRAAIAAGLNSAMARIENHQNCLRT